MASLIGLDSTSSGFDPGLQVPPVTFGVWGDSGDADGVIGSSNTGVGVFGRSIDASAAAVKGSSENGTGVEATSAGGTALHARRDPGGGAAVTEAFLATPSLAAEFRGDIATTGGVSVGGRLGAGSTAPRAAVGIRGVGATEELLSFEDNSGVTRWHVNQRLAGQLGLNFAEAEVADGDGRLYLQAGGNVGIGTTAPTHPLHVAKVLGIRQNELYLSGGVGWSSLSYNAFHNEANSDWVFPDPSRPAVTVEMDDSGGNTRFQVWSTTRENPTGWVQRLAIDGQGGGVSIPSGGVGISHGQLSVTNDLPVRPGPFGNVPANAVCAQSTNGAAVFASGKTAVSAIGPSQFTGDVDVSGIITGREKRCLVDHPSDPENKTLTHACVESDERFNVYSGNIALDTNGEARVTLPEWVAKFNRDFRYQLTCIGQAAPVYVAQEVSKDSFSIAGGAAGMKVSWQLTGIRDDAWAQANPLAVEQEKPDDEKGFFLSPEVFGHDLTRHTQYKRLEQSIRAYPRQAEQVMRTYDAVRKARSGPG
jgi:trimeric autotransporter adhesin